MEQTPVISVKGGNGENFKMTVERFFGISTRPRKVVILGKVLEGELHNNGAIKISNGARYLEDYVRRIEVNKKEISFAVKNEEIGICLTKTTLKELRALNSPQK